MINLKYSLFLPAVMTSNLDKKVSAIIASTEPTTARSSLLYYIEDMIRKLNADEVNIHTLVPVNLFQYFIEETSPDRVYLDQGLNAVLKYFSSRSCGLLTPTVDGTPAYQIPDPVQVRLHRNNLDMALIMEAINKSTIEVDPNLTPNHAALEYMFLVWNFGVKQGTMIPEKHIARYIVAKKEVSYQEALELCKEIELEKRNISEENLGYPLQSYNQMLNMLIRLEETGAVRETDCIIQDSADSDHAEQDPVPEPDTILKRITYQDDEQTIVDDQLKGLIEEYLKTHNYFTIQDIGNWILSQDREKGKLEIPEPKHVLDRLPQAISSCESIKKSYQVGVSSCEIDRRSYAYFRKDSKQDHLELEYALTLSVLVRMAVSDQGTFSDEEVDSLILSTELFQPTNGYNQKPEQPELGAIIIKGEHSLTGYTETILSSLKANKLVKVRKQMFSLTELGKNLCVAYKPGNSWSTPLHSFLE